jgi:alkanesulfonate monooxygenase SsuD/methylene tetrahydromethanopterin reductase-like flavin-dependent oxidoreductase (luciferase family)
VRIGVVLPMFSNDPGRVLSFAGRAEELGFDGVFAYDHLMPLGGPDDGPALECFATLSAVAAATTSIRVGTLVARASLRPVGLLAKLATQLDLISGGRAILAVGTGDDLSKREHDAFGLPYLEADARRAHLAETMRALSQLFAGRAWVGGSSVPAIAGPLLPPPSVPGGPPRWVGGTSRAVVRIAAETAHAWNGWGLDEERFAQRVRLLASVADERGREVEATWGGIALVGRDEDETARLVDERRRRGLDAEGVWIGTAEQVSIRLERIAAMGATWAIVLPAGPPDRLEVIAELVAPRARGGA